MRHSFNVPRCRAIANGAWRLALILFAPFSLWFMCSAAFAQTPLSRLLTLIQPNNPNFDTVLNQNFPGLQQLAAYQNMRPFLLILQNGTSYPVEAYAVTWETRAPDGHIMRSQVSYIQKHYLPRTELRPLIPGETRLLSPYFNIGPAQYLVQHDTVGQLMASVTAHSPIVSQHLFTSVAAYIDSVIFADGAYTGPDHFQLVLRYQALRDAERDEANSILPLVESNAPAEQVQEALRQDAEKGLRVKTVPGHPDHDALYTLYRGRQAQQLITAYKSGGYSILQQRAEAMAHRPKKTLTPLSAQPPQ